MKDMTMKQACELWVSRDMDAIQQGMIAELMRNNPEDWREITPPASGDRVYVMEDIQDTGEIIEADGMFIGGERQYLVELDSGNRVLVPEGYLEVEHYDGLPMWGTMWSFNDNADVDWLQDHLQEMASCGFRIYESELYGYFFGIDGAGYDFYSSHWLPLYKAVGLQWHEGSYEDYDEYGNPRKAA